ncbi:OFA family MFS transporter [Vallitalea pronyensis]|uniref:OFA family MFS transporter n=1 Tax=Vallitalea pronyensis TaxID=1348613 RepID=A0A8J8MPF5_9FIRM|nr:OFA family MFS transporter [Vallitalea pronyensis]QUI25146.1 OFA family MFS transporter [Vallitalea pronyensis]
MKNHIQNSISRSSDHDGYRRWMLVILGMIMFICLGTVYSWSVFKTPIEELYNINAAISGLPYLVFLLMYTASMVITGRMIDRVDPRIMIIIGGLMVGVGWILSGVAVSFSMIVLSYGVLSGAGVGIAYGPPIKVISSSFVKKPGVALGLLLAGFGLSPLITAPITKQLINQIGIHDTFIAVGVFFIVVIPLLGLCFKKPQVQEQHVKIQSKMTEDSSVRALIRNTKFQGLWLCFVIGTTIGLMIIGISSQIGEELFGIDTNTTATLLAIFAIFNAVGRPLFGWITDRYSPFIAAMVSFILIFISALLMYAATDYRIVLYVITLSIFWMNLGAWLSIAPTTIAMYFGEANYSRNYGVLFTAYGIGAVIGTPMAGLIRTQFGSYKYVFIPIMFLAVKGIIIALFTIRNKKKLT